MAVSARVLLGGVGLAMLGRAVARRRRAIDLGGQVVLITGGSRGLGLAMAEEFAGRGARVAICGRSETELERARQYLAGQGAEVLAVSCDVGDRAQVERLVAETTARFGRIDILVNNAGVIMVGPVESQTLTDFEEAMAVMYWGAVYPTLAVLPQMLERRQGRIVNITSIGGKVSVPHLLSYNAAKFAAVGFSEGLGAELASRGIRVVTVVPWLMRTGSFVNALFKGQHRLEYAWFSLGASLPLITMDARRAARRIVEATRRGETEVILSPLGSGIARFHGLFPGTTTEILGVINRLLPGPDGVSQQRRAGKESENALTRSVLTRLGRRAAREFHQHPESGPGQPADTGHVQASS